MGPTRTRFSWRLGVQPCAARQANEEGALVICEGLDTIGHGYLYDGVERSVMPVSSSEPGRSLLLCFDNQ